MKKLSMWAVAFVGSIVAMLSVPAFAVTDTTWVTAGVGAAGSTLTDYVNAAVPLLFPIVVLIVAVYLVFKLVKKATH